MRREGEGITCGRYFYSYNDDGKRMYMHVLIDKVLDSTTSADRVQVLRTLRIEAPCSNFPSRQTSSRAKSRSLASQVYRLYLGRSSTWLYSCGRSIHFSFLNATLKTHRHYRGFLGTRLRRAGPFLLPIQRASITQVSDQKSPGCERASVRKQGPV